MLIQAKRFASETLDPIAGNRRTERTRRDGQTQPRSISFIGEDRQTEICVGQFSATLSNLAKFGRLVQTLARLEIQFTDR